MLRKNIRSYNWNKYIYYVSNDVIFDIATTQKTDDLDECGTYLIDMENAPDFVKKAKDGELLNIHEYPEIFANNIPYMKLTFTNPNGTFLEYYYPLQFLIEKGDKIINGKAVQSYPNVFDNRYVHKFNHDVYNYIRDLVKDKEIFDSKTIDFVMNSLPDWLTREIEMKYMTKTYIEEYFLRGKHYDQKEATKGAKGNDDIYQFINAVIGVGMEPEDSYAPINIWQKETIEKTLKAIDAEKIVNKYNTFIKSDLDALSVDAMEKIAYTIKTAETGFNINNLKTFLNVKYRDHDCEDISFESICAGKTIDTYYEYLKRKEETPELIFEEVIEQDKAYMEQYIQKNFETPLEVVKTWYESSVTMENTYTAGSENNKIESIINVFGVAVESLRYMAAIMIYHTGNTRNVVEYKNSIWLSDNDMYQRTDQIVKTFKQAYDIMMNSDYPKIESRQCVLRAALGPNGATTPPQYIFGNIHTQLYVDAMTGAISNISPVFPEEEGTSLQGSFEDIVARQHQLVNNRFNLNYWCETNGAFIDFIDSGEFDVKKLYEVNSIFKTSTDLYIYVTETDDDGQQVEQLENVTFEPMPEVEIITLEDAINIIMNESNLPHSEKFKLINDNGTPKYKFGSISEYIIVNAITGEIEE